MKDRSGEDGVNAELIEAFYKALAEYSAWCAAKPELPYGDDTEAVLSAYQSLDAKVRDFFVRSKVAAFSPDNAAKLDVQSAWIEAIAGSDLASKLKPHLRKRTDAGQNYRQGRDSCRCSR